MFDKNTDWSYIDYLCLKAKKGEIYQDIYYLEGHPEFKKSLTVSDKNFIDFTRTIGVYGISEKMLGKSSISDRFYIRVNISSELQESMVIDYLTKEKEISFEQKNLLKYLSDMDSVVGNGMDYRWMYYCGFSKKLESLNYDSIRFYFKTFGVDESPKYDLNWIEYCDQCPMIRNDRTYQIVRELILNGQAGLRCIGVDIVDTDSTKIKYYIYPINNCDTDILLKLQEYPQYKQNVDELLKKRVEVQELYCDLLQISGGFNNREKSINMYLKSKKIYKKNYYSLREGLILRDIGGVMFLIDIHEKHYYDMENLFSVNETGQVIIRYLIENGVCTLDGIVSHLCSLINNYSEELYSTIYADCKMFVEQLHIAGYLQEVI